MQHFWAFSFMIAFIFIVNLMSTKIFKSLRNNRFVSRNTEEEKNILNATFWFPIIWMH